MRPYTIIDHEADIGFEVQAHTREELFQNAASALFSVIVEQAEEQPDTRRYFETGTEDDSLIVFLNELLYLWESEKFIPLSLNISISDSVTMEILGTILKREDRILGTIKAVTYHRFSLIEQDGVFKATFIADM